MITKVEMIWIDKSSLTETANRVRLTWWNDGEYEGYKHFDNFHDAALWVVEQEVDLLLRSDPKEPGGLKNPYDR